MWLAAAGVAAAVAFMLKGFLAFALPAIVAAPFLIWRREWKKLFTFPWLPLAVVLLIALPWALFQHYAEGMLILALCLLLQSILHLNRVRQ